MKLSKNRLKILRSLNQKKFRQKYQIFIAEGHKIAMDSFHGGQYPLVEIIATKNWLEKYEQIIPDELKSQVLEASTTEMEQLSSLRSRPEVILIMSMMSNNKPIRKRLTELSFYLDDIQDPGNMGTIIRTAEWFGLKSVIKSPDSVDFFNAKVIQAAMGSFNRVALVESDLETYLGDIDVPVYGTSMDGKDVWDFEGQSKGIIVIGNEGKGMSNRIKKLCTEIITIPDHNSNAAESLNAGLSAGIIASIMAKKS